MHSQDLPLLHRLNLDGLRPPIERYLELLHARYKGLDVGTCASYIPELARVDPDLFGICIATRDGHVYEIGDAGHLFTIQSVSKALVHGLALHDQGEQGVLERIGVEPSGEAFNAISLRPGTGAPFNPMINAGAIAATGMIRPKPGRKRIDRLLQYLSGCAGRDLDIDEAVYRSESETGHRNRAIGWMLRNFDILREEPTDTLETYFQQCAIRVSCRDLAVMAATLANGGINPITKREAIEPRYVPHVLSVMATCGMYDYSGEWLYRVGLPAKSGVGGGILAVLPGQLGIGVFSPRLDEHGNSVRGIRVCNDLTRDLALHLFQVGSEPAPALRLSYDNAQVTSSRQRAPAHRDIIRREGHRVRLLELQGKLIFSTIEPILRQVEQASERCQHFILNFFNVLSADEVSLKLLCQLQATLAARGVRLLASHIERLREPLYVTGFRSDACFVNDDAALEDCENRLLEGELGMAWNAPYKLPLGDCELFGGCSPEDVAWLETQMPEIHFDTGQHLVRKGDPGTTLYVLLSGSVEVRLPAPHGGRGKRLGVFTAGMSFGEMAFIDGAPRSADVVALGPVSCRTMHRPLFDAMETDNPRLKISILTQLTRTLSANVRRSNNEALAFRGNR